MEFRRQYARENRAYSRHLAPGLRDRPVVNSDVVVPDGTGTGRVGAPEGSVNKGVAASRTRPSRPSHHPVLFITGYAENAIIGNGQLAPGMRVLTKPFVVETFAARVLEMTEDRT